MIIICHQHRHGRTKVRVKPEQGRDVYRSREKGTWPPQKRVSREQQDGCAQSLNLDSGMRTVTGVSTVLSGVTGGRAELPSVPTGRVSVTDGIARCSTDGFFPPSACCVVKQS